MAVQFAYSAKREGNGDRHTSFMYPVYANFIDEAVEKTLKRTDILTEVSKVICRVPYAVTTRGVEDRLFSD